MACKRRSTEVRVELSKGWKAGALSKQYTGYDSSLLSLNDKLNAELIYASHLIQIPDIDGRTDGARDDEGRCGDDEDGCGDGYGREETDSFAEIVADIYTLDRACGVCHVISEYRKKFPPNVEWMADYALLCHKSQAVPMCATTTFVTAFELVFVMDKHYLPLHGASLVGEFGRRNLFLADVQKHFFLNGCFTPVEGGLVSKIDLNNYAFLVQSVARYAVTSFGGGGGQTSHSSSSSSSFSSSSSSCGSGGGAPSLNVASRGGYQESSLSGAAAWNSPKTSSTAVALLKWLDYARPLECFGRNRRRGIKRTADEAGLNAMTCVQRSEADDFAREQERDAVEDYSPQRRRRASDVPLRGHTKWGFGDLTALLLAGTASLPSKLGAEHDTLSSSLSPPRRRRCHIQEIAEVRKRSAQEYHEAVSETIAAERGSNAGVDLKFFGGSSQPATSLGPILASALPHPIGRGGTGGECLLCNLMLTEEYWRATRLLKARVVGKDTNAGLFDGVEPSVEEFDEYANLTDEGRMLSLLKSVGPNAIYKHLFCDPMCAINALRVDPDVVWGNPPRDDPEVAELYKAELAARPNFSERICRGLWILAFAFKAYQLANPRPTALNAFVRSADTYLRRHGLHCIALEHALTRYV